MTGRYGYVQLEKDVEKALLRKLKMFPELKVRKMNGMGYNSWPDRMILGKKRFVQFLELKRPGKEKNVSDGQEILFGELDDLGFDVPIFSDANLAFNFIVEEYKKWLEKNGNPPSISLKQRKS